MDSDFFTDETHNIETNQELEEQPHNDEETIGYQEQQEVHDEFDFGESQYEAPQINMHNSVQENVEQDQNQYGSYSNFETNEVSNDAATNKIREEEERIQSLLREKAYELKNKRREQGRKQLEEFQDKKEEETIARKQSNRSKQELNAKESSSREETNGWKKVADNVQLKQSENQGKKDITRMREAIINKRSDKK